MLLTDVSLTLTLCSDATDRSVLGGGGCQLLTDVSLTLTLCRDATDRSVFFWGGGGVSSVVSCIFQTFVVADYFIEMTAKKSLKNGEYEKFEHLPFCLLSFLLL